MTFFILLFTMILIPLAAIVDGWVRKSIHVKEGVK